MDDEVLIIGLIVAAGLAFIPASIAKKKGYSFGLWWLYGWLLFIVAIIPNMNNFLTISGTVTPICSLKSFTVKFSVVIVAFSILTV